jgi:hypothetical protein
MAMTIDETQKTIINAENQAEKEFKASALGLLESEVKALLGQ